MTSCVGTSIHRFWARACAEMGAAETWRKARNPLDDHLQRVAKVAAWVKAIAMIVVHRDPEQAHHSRTACVKWAVVVELRNPTAENLTLVAEVVLKVTGMIQLVLRRVAKGNAK